jgi:hypothetical protein
LDDAEGVRRVTNQPVRTFAHVVNVGHDWFTFTLPAAVWKQVSTHVFTMGRLLVPRAIDDALDEGQWDFDVTANVRAEHPSQVQFKYWAV